MPRCVQLLVILAAATLHGQSASNRATAVDPSQTRPTSAAVPTRNAAPQTPKIDLVASPIPDSLSPLHWDGELIGIPLCDPIDCLGEAPKLVTVDGKLTIHFPDSYKKPTAETKDAATKVPASRETSGEPGATRK